MFSISDRGARTIGIGSLHPLMRDFFSGHGFPEEFPGLSIEAARLEGVKARRRRSPSSEAPTPLTSTLISLTTATIPETLPRYLPLILVHLTVPVGIQLPQEITIVSPRSVVAGSTSPSVPRPSSLTPNGGGVLVGSGRLDRQNKDLIPPNNRCRVPFARDRNLPSNILRFTPSHRRIPGIHYPVSIGTPPLRPIGAAARFRSVQKKKEDNQTTNRTGDFHLSVGRVTKERRPSPKLGYMPTDGGNPRFRWHAALPSHEPILFYGRSGET